MYMTLAAVRCYGTMLDPYRWTSVRWAADIYTPVALTGSSFDINRAAQPAFVPEDIPLISSRFYCSEVRNRGHVTHAGFEMAWLRPEVVMGA